MLILIDITQRFPTFTSIEDTSMSNHPLSQITTVTMSLPWSHNQLVVTTPLLKLLEIDHPSTEIRLRNSTLILILTLITCIHLFQSNLSIGGLFGTSAPSLVFHCGCRYITCGGRIISLSFKGTSLLKSPLHI